MTKLVWTRWNGSVSGKWGDPDNWDGGSVPPIKGATIIVDAQCTHTLDIADMTNLGPTALYFGKGGGTIHCGDGALHTLMVRDG